MKAQIVVDAPSRQVVLIVEDEALARVTAVDMIEQAGFEVLEAANADEAILLLEARRDITGSSPISKCRVRWTASGSLRPSEANGRPSKSSRHRAVAWYATAICRLADCSCQNLTALRRFPEPYGTSRPKPRTRPWPTPLTSGTGAANTSGAKRNDITRSAFPWFESYQAASASL
jgi:CheY-like chemotaxis protein